MFQLALEAFIVGILNLFIGFIISYISMGDKAKTFDHWPGVLLSFFITGVIIHLVCEVSGLNKKYCKYGNACKN
jgi:hypothetical protein